MESTPNVFLTKVRRKLAERGYAGKALEAKLQELMAKPLSPELAALMEHLKRDL